MVNQSEGPTDNQDSSITSVVPIEEHRDQHPTTDEEDRPERFRSVQEIYDVTQELDKDEACLFFGEEPTSFTTSMKEEVWRRAMKEEIEAIEKKLYLGACKTTQKVQIDWS